MDGAAFKLSYLDFFTTAAPVQYEVIGTLRGRALFTSSGTMTGSAGTFKRVFPSENVVIDGVIIRITNAAAAGSANVMALDNIVTRY